MLSSYLQGIASRQLAARREEVRHVSTPEQFEKRRARIRKALVGMIGGLSDEKTALNLRRTGALQRDGYRVEKIVYESRPRFYVAANLYIPTRGRPERLRGSVSG